MRRVLCLPVVLVSVVACAEAPNESSTSSEVVIANRVVSNRVVSNRVVSNRVVSNRIAGQRVSGNRMAVNMQTAGEMLATTDGREIFALIVSCAMREDITLTATIAGTEFDFFGEIGLAPQWLSRPLGTAGQRWVSACMFARVNGHESAIPISMRGSSRALVVDDDERGEWSLEEGAFFGNFFGRLDRPLQWYACRGKDQAQGEAGGLADRDCAEPDPANPGFTRCGMVFVGDCGSFAADHACESFSNRGTFYRACHTETIGGGCDRDQDLAEIDDDDGVSANAGFDGLSHRRDGRVFDQVITTFVTP
jgi:hypothetical protein